MFGRRWKLVSVSLFLVAVLSGCGQSTSNSESSAVDSSDAAQTELFKSHCASCHGENLQGGFGPNLQKVGSKYTEEEINNIIKNGKGRMPRVSSVSDKDRQHLAAWLAEHK